jgi:acetate kinase
MKHSEPERITPKLLAELHRITPYAPDHLPREISLIESFRKRHPKLPQVACFDTAFHHGMPPLAKMLSIPRCDASKDGRKVTVGVIHTDEELMIARSVCRSLPLGGASS